MKSPAISRRALLRGVGGALLASPFLESLSGRAFAADAPAVPTRLVIYQTGQGTIPARWRPPTVAGEALELSELLAPLAAFRDRLVVVSGVANRIPRHLRSNAHNAPGHTLMTADLAETAYDEAGRLIPVAQQRELRAADACVSASFDAELAARLGAVAPLNLAIGQLDPGENRMFYRVRREGQTGPAPVAALANDPAAVFRDRVAGFQPGSAAASASSRDRLRAHRPTVLSAVKGSIRDLQRKVSMADRRRLEAHAARIADLEARLDRPSPGACTGLEFRAPEGLPGRTPSWKATWPEENLYARAQIDVAVAALTCGAARVVTLQHTVYHSPTFDFLGRGPMEGWHAMVHGEQGGPPAENAGLAAGFRWYADSFAHLLERMQGVVEPDGRTLLDNSLVLWISEFGDASRHSTADLPVVLAGGLQGRLRTGRHVQASGAATADLFASLFELYGVSSDGFGFRGESDLFRGGIAGLA